MAKQYFTLVAKNPEGAYEIVFGDYDKAVVKKEQAELDRTYYKAPKIISTMPKQSSIDEAVNALNSI